MTPKESDVFASLTPEEQEIIRPLLDTFELVNALISAAAFFCGTHVGKPSPITQNLDQVSEGWLRAKHICMRILDFPLREVEFGLALFRAARTKDMGGVYKVFGD